MTKLDGPTLYLVAGKIAAGKSTLAAALAKENRAVLLDADKLQSALWPGEILTLEDYRTKWPRLCAAVGPIVTDILKAGVSVVLDFPGNTKGQRTWMLGLAKEAAASHKLYFIDTPDEVCKQRLEKRNASGTHPYAPTAEQFDQFMAFLTPPSEEEGLTIIHVADAKHA